MKKWIYAAAAALSLLTISSPALAGDGRHGYRDDDRGRYEDDRDWRDRDRDWNERGGAWRDRDGRGDGHWQYQGRRERDYDSRWDHRRYNGYYYDNRFFYGPPPSHYFGRPNYRPGYRAWVRGQRLPPFFLNYYRSVDDWGHYRLRPPPRGCRWVRDDRGDFLLVAIATGAILSTILDGGSDRYYDRY